MRRPAFLSLLAFAASACASSPPPPPPPVVDTRPPPPSGPTRTDFKTIARKLVGRCVAGGWVNRWRSTHENPDVAKPRIFLTAFLDETGQDLDSDYLRSVLEQRMRLSGVYEMVAEGQETDFVAQGKLKRLAERVNGERVSIYTALLEIENVGSGKRAHQCEASVQGEI